MSFKLSMTKKTNVKPIHLYNYMMFYLVSSFIVKLLFFKICQIVSITAKQIFSKILLNAKLSQNPVLLYGN